MKDIKELLKELQADFEKGASYGKRTTWNQDKYGKTGTKLFRGLVGEYAAALEENPTDPDGYTKSIERLQRAQTSLERDVGAKNKYSGWQKIYNELTPAFAKRIGELQGASEKYRIDKFKTEARGIRDAQVPELEQELSNIASMQFETMFKPQIRESLNARGIMGGGAEQEMGASTKAGLHSTVQKSVLDYELGTEELDQSLGLEGQKAKFGNVRSGVITGFSNTIAGAANALASELANITRPGFIDYFTNAAQIAGLYSQYKGTGSGSSGGSGSSCPSSTADTSGGSMPSPRPQTEPYSKASAGTQGGLGNKFDSGPAV